MGGLISRLNLCPAMPGRVFFGKVRGLFRPPREGRTLRALNGGNMSKFKAQASALAWLACAVSIGCGGADDNAIDPAGETPFDRVEIDGVKVWRVKWDNPAVGTVYELPSIGYAIRNGLAWEYNKFDLEVEINDSDGPDRHYTFPSFIGTFGDDETSFNFEARGTKLDPMVDGDPFSSMTTAVGYHDTYNAPELVLEDPLGNTEGRFQLDPAVGLAPLRVVVLHGDELKTPIFFGPALSPGWFSRKWNELLFDDMWRASKHINTNQPISPDNVISEWTHQPGSGHVANPLGGGGRYIQPDRILDQCDVQFRMVSYHSCEVPPEILYNGECESSLGQYLHANSVRSYVANNCDVPGDIPWVMFVGSLGAGSCVSGTLQGAQDGGDVWIANSHAGRTTLAHELGHLVGLAPGNNHPSDPNNLMGPGGQGLELDAEQCETANSRAKELQKKYWTQSAQFDSADKEYWTDPDGQFSAQDLWRSFDREQLDRLGKLLGPTHLAFLRGSVWGDDTAWRRGVPHIESLAVLYQRQLSEILTEEQLRLLYEVLGE